MPSQSVLFYAFSFTASGIHANNTRCAIGQDEFQTKNTLQQNVMLKGIFLHLVLLRIVDAPANENHLVYAIFIENRFMS